MTKIKLKYEFLVSGIYPFDGEYQKRGYTLIKHIVNDKIYNEYMDNDECIYISPLIVYCVYSYKGNSVYLTFEKEEIIELESAVCVKEFIKNLTKRKNMVEEGEILEKSLTIELNNFIRFPIKILKIYDINDNLLGVNMNIMRLNVSPLLCSDTESYFERIGRQNCRLNFGLSYDQLAELNKRNSLFKRALNFYFSSFASCDENVGFVLLITALETLFNISTYSEVENCLTCSQPIYNIGETISNNIKLILMDEGGNIKSKIKSMYNKRSNYVHGRRVKISKEDEYNLQEYTRMSLLMYWFISLNISSYEHKKIIAEFQKKDYKQINNYKAFLVMLKEQSFLNIQKDIIKFFSK